MGIPCYSLVFISFDVIIINNTLMTIFLQHLCLNFMLYSWDKLPFQNYHILTTFYGPGAFHTHFSQLIFTTYEISLFPFYRWRIWGLERFIYLAQDHLARKFWNWDLNTGLSPDSRSHTLKYYALLLPYFLWWNYWV